MPAAKPDKTRNTAEYPAFHSNAASLVPDVLNLDRETEATKKQYGLDATEKNKRFYETQCLRARRLIESGVRFVETTCPEVFGGDNGTWPQHSGLRKWHEGNAQITDQGVAALLKNLKSRGLLQQTLVVLATEFGRTPHAPTPDGRDNHETAFSVWMAGGGLKPGFTYGVTDETGMAGGGKCDRGLQPARHDSAVIGARSQKAHLPLWRTSHTPPGRPRQRD